MPIRFLLTLFLLISSVPVFAGNNTENSAPNESGEMKTIIDSMGTEVSIPVSPKRVAITADRGAASFFISAGVPIVGVTSRNEYAPFLVEALNDFEGIADLGSHREANLEILLKIQPDLIVARGNEDPKFLEMARKIAPTIQFKTDIGIREVIENFATVMGQDYADLITQQVDASVAKMSAVVENPSSISVSHGNVSVSSLRLYMDNSNYASQLIKEAGFSRPSSQTSDVDFVDNNSIEISFEEIPLLDGDILFIGSYVDDEELKKVFESPLWGSLDVVNRKAVVRSYPSYWNFGAGLAAMKIAEDFVSGFNNVWTDGKPEGK